MMQSKRSLAPSSIARLFPCSSLSLRALHVVVLVSCWPESSGTFQASSSKSGTTSIFHAENNAIVRRSQRNSLTSAAKEDVPSLSHSSSVVLQRSSMASDIPSSSTPATQVHGIVRAAASGRKRLSSHGNTSGNKNVVTDAAAFRIDPSGALSTPVASTSSAPNVNADASSRTSRLISRRGVVALDSAAVVVSLDDEQNPTTYHVAPDTTDDNSSKDLTEPSEQLSSNTVGLQTKQKTNVTLHMVQHGSTSVRQEAGRDLERLPGKLNYVAAVGEYGERDFTEAFPKASDWRRRLHRGFPEGFPEAGWLLLAGLLIGGFGICSGVFAAFNRKDRTSSALKGLRRQVMHIQPSSAEALQEFLSTPLGEESIATVVRLEGRVVPRASAVTATSNQCLIAPFSLRNAVFYSASVSQNQDDGVHSVPLAFHNASADFDIEIATPDSRTILVRVSKRGVALFDMGGGRFAQEHAFAEAPEAWKGFVISHLTKGPDRPTAAEVGFMSRMFEFKESALVAGTMVTAVGELVRGIDGQLELWPVGASAIAAPQAAWCSFLSQDGVLPCASYGACPDGQPTEAHKDKDKGTFQRHSGLLSRLVSWERPVAEQRHAEPWRDPLHGRISISDDESIPGQLIGKSGCWSNPLQIFL